VRPFLGTIGALSKTDNTPGKIFDMQTIKTIGVSLCIALFGAGCAAQQPTSSVASSSAKSNISATQQVSVLLNKNNAPDSNPKVTQKNIATGSRAVSAVSSTIAADGTWQMYTSKTLGFTFRWPTRGSYAPTWEVKLLKASNREIKNGCDIGKNLPLKKPEQITTRSGVTFCHTSAVDAGAGQFYFVDAFATHIDGTIVVITLTKHVVNAGILGCSFTKNYPYSTSGARCNPFQADKYRAEYMTILSTFNLKPAA